ncbi:hypothetical protein ACXOJ5_09025 [Streptococcus thermophilus]|nr:hypothetical protein [Streptococcus thermophilus]
MKSLETKIRFFPDFVFKKEGEKSYIAGRKNLNRYIEISEDAYEIIKSIVKLEDLDLIKQELYSFSEGEIEDFIDQLVELNFLEIYEGKLITSETINKKGFSFPWISQRILKCIFNKVIIFIWGLYLTYVYFW